MAALDSNTFSSDAAKSAFSKALDLLKTAEAHRSAILELAGGRGEQSALDQLAECLTYCLALQSLDLDDTQVSDLTPLAALVANGLEITDVDPAL